MLTSMTKYVHSGVGTILLKIIFFPAVISLFFLWNVIHLLIINSSFTYTINETKFQKILNKNYEPKKLLIFLRRRWC